MKTKVISFIGSHGVGKTTMMYEFAAWLRKNNYSVSFVHETAARSPFPINKEATFLSQSYIQYLQMFELCLELNLWERRYANGFNKDSFILCDRSPLDTLIYTKYVANEKEYEYFKRICLLDLELYDKLYFLPALELNISENGITDTDEKFRADIQNDLLTFIFDTENIKNKTDILYGTFPERIENLKNNFIKEFEK